jgi:hypothetical protein
MSQVYKLTLRHEDSIDAMASIASSLPRHRMGFAAPTRGTEGPWVACSLPDQIDLGLKPGSKLKVATTVCHGRATCWRGD